MYQYLIEERSEGRLTLMLNRPEVYNAFHDAMSQEFMGALKNAGSDPGIRVLVLTGAGKAFCSGQDLKADPGASKRDYRASLQQRYNPMIRAIRNLPKPVICQLNGVAAGAGCSLALACDLVIASETAYLLEAFIHIGLVPDSGATWFFPRTIGYHRAFELAAKGNRLGAREAQQLGLVNRVVPGEELQEAIEQEVAYFAQAPTQTIALIKKMLNRGIAESLEATLDYEALCQEIASGSQDHQEGLKAFLEKRKAEFQGK